MPMNRRKFLQNSVMGAIGLTMAHPLFAQDSSWPADELMGKVNPALFGKGYRLRKKASDAFIAMQKDARMAGIQLHSLSSYRSYAHQERIWTRKYQRFTQAGMSPEKAIAKIVEYSTIPGTSRHHWGTDLDMVDASVKVTGDQLLAKNYHAGGPYEKLGDWLREHAESYGFYLVYTNNPARKGFSYEPWHYSFKELSCSMLDAYLSLDLKGELEKAKLLGSEHFTEAFISSYIQDNIKGINPVLL